LNIRPETIILLEENIYGNFHDFGLDNNFFGFDSKSNGNKSKNKQVELQQTNKLLHSRGDHQQSEKATYGMGENIGKSYICKGLISKIYKEHIQFNNNNNNE